MAERVVDRLEAIDVDEMQGGEFTGRGDGAQPLLQGLDEMRPVVEAGRRVVADEKIDAIVATPFLAPAPHDRDSRHAEAAYDEKSEFKEPLGEILLHRRAFRGECRGDVVGHGGSRRGIGRLRFGRREKPLAQQRRVEMGKGGGVAIGDVIDDVAQAEIGAP